MRVNVEGAKEGGHNRYFVESSFAEDLLLLNSGNPTGSDDHWSALLFGLVESEDHVDLAAVATAIAVVLGTAGALGVALRRGRTLAVVGNLYVGPLLVPALVLAVSMAAAFRPVEVRLSLWRDVAGHVVVNASCSTSLVTAWLKGFDWSLVQPARTLDATASAGVPSRDRAAARTRCCRRHDPPVRALVGQLRRVPLLDRR